MNYSPKLSYIIPVYNVAEYIERCVVSLFEQDYPNIEYIFIDDHSTDNSMTILTKMIEKYPKRKKHTTLITHNSNKGSATSRNEGLCTATGEYVMFADSDDWIAHKYVSCMIEKIISEKKDIVYCDYYTNSNINKQKKITQNFGTNPLSCIYSMMIKDMHGSVWNKIYKRDFLLQSKQRFLDGADMYEDVSWNIRLFSLTNNIGYFPQAFYHYVQNNSNSIIYTYNQNLLKRKRCMQRIYNIDCACNLLKRERLLNGQILAASKIWKLLAKCDIISETKYSLKRWIVTFSDADSVIWNCPYFSLNYKIQLYLLHLKLVPLYKLQKKITSFAK